MIKMINDQKLVCYVSLHFATLRYAALRYATLHYTTLHYSRSFFVCFDSKHLFTVNDRTTFLNKNKTLRYVLLRYATDDQNDQ
jgi:hypothetical protein